MMSKRLLQGDDVRVKTGTHKGKCGRLGYSMRRPGMYHGFWSVVFEDGHEGFFCSLELEKLNTSDEEW